MTFQHVRQRVVKRRRIFSEPGFVISSTKYQLHDRDHWRARLRLDACILQQFGIIVGAALSHQCETVGQADRSEEHTSELQSLMRISYAVFCLKKKKTANTHSLYNTQRIHIN